MASGYADTVATVELEIVPADQLKTRQLHDLLRLRVDVFVVEQECPYPEVDGRDLEPGTTHLWLEENGTIVSSVRLLTDAPAGGEKVMRIGRVVTAPENRGAGHADTVMRAAIDLCDGPIELDAQSYLEGWYARFGFEANGPEFVEDGIPHIPMRRE